MSDASIRVCPSCGTESGAGAKLCYNCGADLSAPRVTPEYSASGTAAASAGAPSVVKRYSDAYSVARATVAFGQTIKMLAFGLAGLVVIGGLVASSSSNSGPLMLILAAVAGVVVAIPIYILGVLVSAGGQILKANLDTAVHTSPFLSEGEMSKVMSLG